MKIVMLYVIVSHTALNTHSAFTHNQENYNNTSVHLVSSAYLTPPLSLSRFPHCFSGGLQRGRYGAFAEPHTSRTPQTPPPEQTHTQAIRMRWNVFSADGVTDDLVEGLT